MCALRWTRREWQMQLSPAEDRSARCHPSSFSDFIFEHGSAISLSNAGTPPSLGNHDHLPLHAQNIVKAANVVEDSGLGKGRAKPRNA